MFDIPDTLPNKLSELMRLAVSDLKKSREAGALFDMGEWYTPLDRYNGDIPEGFEEAPCVVCVAGAVIAQEFGSEGEIIREVTAADFTTSLDNKLMALNDARRGHFLTAISHLETPRVSSTFGDEVAFFEPVHGKMLNDSEIFITFCEQFLQVAQILEGYGH